LPSKQIDYRLVQLKEIFIVTSKLNCVFTYQIYLERLELIVSRESIPLKVCLCRCRDLAHYDFVDPRTSSSRYYSIWTRYYFVKSCL